MGSDSDYLVAWLNDAYAMEKALGEVLERHAKDAEGDAEVHDRIVQHQDETHQQAEIVKSCIEELGGSVSRSKSAFSTLFGAAEGMMNRPVRDTMVKNAIADYSAEQFEIASYRALIVTAEDLGQTSVAAKLRGILDQEIAMAQFLESHLAGTVRQHLRAA